MSRWLLPLLALACTPVTLELLPEDPPPPVDNRLAVDGELCTLGTEDLVFPLRVLILVDASESMDVSDPPDPITGESARVTAVRDLATELLDGSGDTKVGVIRFSSESQSLTEILDADGNTESFFTDDLSVIEARLPLLQETDRTTNYVFALSEAYTEIRHELTNTDQEDLALSNVQVILVTDGIPDQEGSGDPTEDIVGAVEALVDLGVLFKVDTLGVSTALISSGSDLVDQQAEGLLEQMAQAGNGTFRSFASGGELNFLYVDLSSLKRVFTLKTLTAWNLNALVRGDSLLPDSDGDGLSDDDERLAGTSPWLPDSDGDGCRDSIEVSRAESGLDPLDDTDCQCYIPDYCFDEDGDGLCDNGCTDADGDNLCDCPDADGDGLCDPDTYSDGDGDGLMDCEERWTGTNNRGPDTDGDGLLDFHELRFGTSADIDDFFDDLDWDVVTNGDEVRTGTDPHQVSEEGRYTTAYRYTLEELPLEAGRTCYSFEVANLTLVETEPLPAGFTATPGPAGQGWTGRNRVLLFAGEVPFDEPESYARFRVACVEAGLIEDGNYRDPPSGRMSITEADFVTLDSFDPAVHCVLPTGREEASTNAP